MTKIAANNDADRLDKLLDAIGVNRDEPFAKLAVEGDLERIKEVYLNKPKITDSNRDKLRQFLRMSQKIRNLRRQLGPSLWREVRLAGWASANPERNDSELRVVDADYDREEGTDPTNLEEGEAENVRAFLARDDYRKSEVRRYLIEPFLSFLSESEREPSVRMFTALFDWVGVPKNRRPSDRSIRSIMRKFQSGRR